MDSLTALVLLYSLVVLGSIGVLSFTFKNRIDTSGTLFLLAEVSILPTVFIIGLAHLDSAYRHPFLILIANATYISSEIFICFSMLSLSREIRRHLYLAAIFIAAVFVCIVEFYRSRDPYLPSLLYPIGFAFIAFATYRICAKCDIPDLRNNAFFNWIKYIELALLVISLARIGSFFISAPVTPFDSNQAAVTLLVVMAAVNISRYVSYQSLRISWVGPSGRGENFLNRSLAKTAHEKERLLRDLVNSNRILGISALAASVVHELSQPLTSAALQTEAIKRDLNSAGADASFTAAMNKVSRQLNRLSDLVKNLRQLFTAKDDEFVLFSFREISEEILELLRASKKNKSINLVVDYRSNPIVHGSPIQIQQVIVNILDNAMEAVETSMVGHKEIKIAVDQAGDFADLSIEDNGAGIHDDMLPVIFDLYKTTKSEGLGLGLWLSKTILDRHGGTIIAENRPEGGARFVIRLPLAEQAS